MSFLIIGGTGHTGKEIVRELRAQGRDARSASRSAREPGDVRFDWLDAATHEAALHGINEVYLVAPPAEPDPLPLMAAFVERALVRGVKRYVLLSSSAIPDTAPGLGAVARLLRERTPEWAVLKPSWFMQNFTDPASPRARTVTEERKLYTSTGEGRVAFVDARDIAAVAVWALTAAEPPNVSLVITGPEALSYAAIARMLDVQLVHIDDAEAKARFVQAGLQADYAEMLVQLDAGIRAGSAETVTDTVERATGHRARSFAEHLRDTSRSTS